MLNPSGVRFGSAEVYAVLEQFGREVADALCVGQRRPHDTDERVLLFLKMRAGQRLTPAFEDKVRSAIRTALSKRHEPSYVFEVADIPVCHSSCRSFVFCCAEQRPHLHAHSIQ